MISNLWTRKGVVLVAAIVTFTCVAALLSVNLASPDPISSAALGADWQCSRIAFVLTTCTPPVRNVWVIVDRIGLAESEPANSRKAVSRSRRNTRSNDDVIRRWHKNMWRKL